jgi:hypothetical protein
MKEISSMWKLCSTPFGVSNGIAINTIAPDSVSSTLYRGLSMFDP